MIQPTDAPPIQAAAIPIQAAAVPIQGAAAVPAAQRAGILARTHAGEPGLPRGRSGLPTEAVRAAQRERLLRSVIAAVAQTGFRGVTVADIVRGARVSRAAFYAHFRDKEDCFLAAARQGCQLMSSRIAAANRAAQAEPDAVIALRAGVDAFLGFLAAEPAFARAFYIDMPTAGPRGALLLEAAQHRFARLNRSWHDRARRDNPSWPVVPYQVYYALAGASTELVRAEVRRGATDTVPGLADTLVSLHLAVLAGIPWRSPDG